MFYLTWRVLFSSVIKVNLLVSVLPRVMCDCICTRFKCYFEGRMPSAACLHGRLEQSKGIVKLVKLQQVSSRVMRCVQVSYHRWKVWGTPCVDGCSWCPGFTMSPSKSQIFKCLFCSYLLRSILPQDTIFFSGKVIPNCPHKNLTRISSSSETRNGMYLFRVAILIFTTSICSQRWKKHPRGQRLHFSELRAHFLSMKDLANLCIAVTSV